MFRAEAPDRVMRIVARHTRQSAIVFRAVTAPLFLRACRAIFLQERREKFFPRAREKSPNAVGLRILRAAENALGAMIFRDDGAATDRASEGERNLSFLSKFDEIMIAKQIEWKEPRDFCFNLRQARDPMRAPRREIREVRRR